MTIDNAVVFGGVETSSRSADKYGNRPIAKARAIRLVYILASVVEADPWIKEFIRVVATLHFDGAKLDYTSSRSLPDEMERNGEA
ncbi:PTR-9 protein [Aphelenchoides avenae]|nr:PTR-9 protein [Aphelenchus avenae]